MVKISSRLEFENLCRILRSTGLECIIDLEDILWRNVMKKTYMIAALILTSAVLLGCNAKSLRDPTFTENSSSNPSKTSLTSFDEEIYSSVIDEYIDCFSDEKEFISGDYVGVSEVIEKEGLEKSKDRFYYFYKDIMGDEEPELFIVRKEDSKENPRYMIIGMYSVFNGAAERQLFGYSEDTHYLMKDGSIYNESIKPSSESRSKYTFTDDKIVDLEYYYFTNCGDYNGTAMYWYTFEERPLGITECIKLGKIGEYEPDLGNMEYYDPSEELRPLIIK